MCRRRPFRSTRAPRHPKSGSARGPAADGAAHWSLDARDVFLFLRHDLLKLGLKAGRGQTAWVSSHLLEQLLLLGDKILHLLGVGVELLGRDLGPVARPADRLVDRRRPSLVGIIVELGDLAELLFADPGGVGHEIRVELHVPVAAPRAEAVSLEIAVDAPVVALLHLADLLGPLDLGDIVRIGPGAIGRGGGGLYPELRPGLERRLAGKALISLGELPLRRLVEIVGDVAAERRPVDGVVAHEDQGALLGGGVAVAQRGEGLQLLDAEQDQSVGGAAFQGGAEQEENGRQSPEQCPEHLAIPVPFVSESRVAQRGAGSRLWSAHLTVLATFPVRPSFPLPMRAELL